MSASSPAARRLSLTLPLLALASLGAPGCSSSGETLGPVTGYVGDGGHDDPEEDDAGESGSTSGDPDGEESTGGEGDGASEPEPEPDDESRGSAPLEPDDGACNVEDDVALWMLPDDSNAMASPVRAREAALGEWGAVQSIAIRTWEFFNYYDFGYPAAEPGSLAIDAALRQPVGAPLGEYVVQIGVSSEALAPEARAPMSLTLVLDTSGSMEGDAMAMLRETCLAIASSLRAGDVVSVVTWSAENAVVLDTHAVSGPDDPELLAKLADLDASGVSDLHAGLQNGYEQALESFASGRINRVVLVSDGGAAMEPADLELIAEHTGPGEQEGIVLVGVGVGDAVAYRDDLIDAATDAGKGATVFVGSAEEAWATFHDDFLATMAVAARNVQVRMDLPPGFALVDAGAEEAIVDATEVQPQHLAPNDALVLHRRIRTCAPALVSDDATITVTAIWIDPVTALPRQVQQSRTIAELMAVDPAPLLKGAAVHAYAESLKAYKHAEPEGRGQTMTGAFAALVEAEAVLPADPELAEIRQVLEALTE